MNYIPNISVPHLPAAPATEVTALPPEQLQPQSQFKVMATLDLLSLFESFFSSCFKANTSFSNTLLRLYKKTLTNKFFVRSIYNFVSSFL